MCTKNTFINRYYSFSKIDNLTIRTGHGCLACSPSHVPVMDDRESVQGVSGATS